MVQENKKQNAVGLSTRKGLDTQYSDKLIKTEGENTDEGKLMENW